MLLIVLRLPLVVKEKSTENYTRNFFFEIAECWNGIDREYEMKHL